MKTENIDTSLPSTAKKLEAANYFYSHFKPSEFMEFLGRGFAVVQDAEPVSDDQKKVVQSAFGQLITISIMFMPVLMECKTEKETVGFLVKEGLEYLGDDVGTRAIASVFCTGITRTDSDIIDLFSAGTIGSYLMNIKDLLIVGEMMGEYWQLCKDEKKTATA